MNTESVMIQIVVAKEDAAKLLALLALIGEFRPEWIDVRPTVVAPSHEQ